MFDSSQENFMLRGMDCGIHTPRVSFINLEYIQEIQNMKFPRKLWLLVNECTTTALRWNPSGTSLIMNYPELQEEYLDRGYFKSNCISSFVRQLNLYGFKKVHYQSEKRRPQTYSFPVFNEFRHPNFIKGRPDLLVLVNRQSTAKARKRFLESLQKKEELPQDETTQRYVHQQQSPIELQQKPLEIKTEPTETCLPTCSSNVFCLYAGPSDVYTDWAIHAVPPKLMRTGSFERKNQKANALVCCSQDLDGKQAYRKTRLSHVVSQNEPVNMVIKRCEKTLPNQSKSLASSSDRTVVNPDCFLGVSKVPASSHEPKMSLREIGITSAHPSEDNMVFYEDTIQPKGVLSNSGECIKICSDEVDRKQKFPLPYSAYLLDYWESTGLLKSNS